MYLKQDFFNKIYCKTNILRLQTQKKSIALRIKCIRKSTFQYKRKKIKNIYNIIIYLQITHKQNKKLVNSNAH